MNRREMIRRTTLAAGGVMFGASCAPRGGAMRTGPGPATARDAALDVAHRRFAPVRVSADRVVRAIAGSRPYRAPGFVVRAERFDDTTVIHNYGHGGGGLSLCWGSSALAVDLASGTSERRAAVIGAGALGLTTARLLQDRGYQVTIYAQRLSPETTSNVAGAQWQPFTVHEGERTTPEYFTQFERAARFAHRYYQSLVGPQYGVRWMENYALSEGPPRRRSDEIADLFPDCLDLAPGQHPFGNRWLRCFETMFIEPNTLLPALTRDFLLRGGHISVRTFHDRAEVLGLEERLIFNCTGLGARALFGDDELIPIKGELVILAPQPEVDYILLAGPSYVFPRSDGIVLGGSSVRGDASQEPDPATVARILADHAAIFADVPAYR